MDTQSTFNSDHLQLIEQVQYNCDISDANHAGNYTLCIYLLKMREYYRWKHALDFSDSFDNDRMSQWLRHQEETWDQIADESFKPIHLADQQYDPFDSSGINSQLINQRLFYHAGIGQKAVQHFFIAELVDDFRQHDIQVRITGKEYARDLTAPPALSKQNEIIIRQESLKRMCWERYQEWRWNQYDNPMGTALSYYPFEDSVSEALQQMVDVEQNTLIQHELGEMNISQQFGAKWSPMMLGLLGSKAELMSRAVRDHLADCLLTLPDLIERNNPASIHFYFANMTYMRKDIFPAAMQAYQRWAENGDLKTLSDLTQISVSHWQKTIRSILEIYDLNKQNPEPKIIALIENSRL